MAIAACTAAHARSLRWGQSMAREHLAIMIRESARAYGAKAAMRYSQDGAVWKSISYAELGEQIQTATKSLLESGIHEGDR